MIQSLIDLYTRDLDRLAEEISSYNQESNLWKTDKNITNSGGNLSLHLIGNLNAFIGNGLGHTGYVRDRTFEFEGKGVSRDQLLSDITELKVIIKQALTSLTDEDLQGDFPIVIWKESTGMVYTLIHLHSHLNYHLGQLNYHRRLLDL